ncbi:sarcosine oxidase subunit gamma family protein [Citricoccus sp. NPDC079358]|jgi:sarcosine oxidase subunit gamma|uniref:sarcosine oxidase subunit gamma n=1 Tax=Citricoccus sp. NPDC079358 TaxID=3154653 RepID=UPI00344FCECD
MAEKLMTRSIRTSPAAHLESLMAEAEVHGARAVSLRELPFAVQIGLRAAPDSKTAQALETVLGVQLPAGHGQSTGDASGQHVLWLSPDEFLVVDVSREQSTGDADSLEAALEGLPGQALDLSANRTILVLAGLSARDVLEKGCQADLHPRSFPVGHAIVTAVGPVPVILHRSAETEFRLYPRASFADFLVRWLVDSMAEFRQEEVL